MRIVMRSKLAAVIAIFLLGNQGIAAVYEVGPGRMHEDLNGVLGRLLPGDVIEYIGDTVEPFEINRSGEPGRPITVRGMTRMKDGLVVRPRIKAAGSGGAGINCNGNWVVIEGFEISGSEAESYGCAALLYAGTDIIIRNCLIRNSFRGVWGDPERAGNVLIEFCEFEGNGYGSKAGLNLYSVRPGSTATVQHCYFHDSTGGVMLRACAPRNIIRYNWFEDPYKCAVQISTAPLFEDPEDLILASRVLPAHSDIVGNVFLYGIGPGAAYSALQIGGDSQVAPGTEGNFNIVHNLFVTKRGGATPAVPVLAHGNVKLIRMYNNAFVEYGARGCLLYERGSIWECPLTSRFVEQNRGTEPAIEGSGNWVFESIKGIPEQLSETYLGNAPRFECIVREDYRPGVDSPLVGKGHWPLPEGDCGSVVPAFEPEKRVPFDLKPRTRREARPPSIGPFEASTDSGRRSGDSERLALDSRGFGRFAWPFDYPLMQQMFADLLAEGALEEALSCAKMQYLLSSTDREATEAAVSNVRQVLARLDGDSKRADEFELFARYGRAGQDGVSGTSDDMHDTLERVALDMFKRTDAHYSELDESLRQKCSVGEGSNWIWRPWHVEWYETERALERVRGAMFEEALSLMIPVMAEVVGRPAADIDGHREEQRNKDLMDRMLALLTVVARARGEGSNGIERFLKNSMDYFRYGPAGEDNLIGTEDDLSILVGEATLSAQETLPESEEQTWRASLEQARVYIGELGGYPLQSRETREMMRQVEAVAEARKRTLYKLSFIAGRSRSGSADSLMFVEPTALELYLYIMESLQTVWPPPSTAYDGGYEEAGERIGALLRLSDEGVIRAYRNVVATMQSEDLLKQTREYLSAYFLGTRGLRKAVFENEEEAYANLSPEKPPLYLVEDCLAGLNDAFLAGEVLETVMKLTRQESDEADDLAGKVAERQFEELKRADGEIAKLDPGLRRERHAETVRRCDEYLRLFPNTGRESEVELLACLHRYRAEDFAQAVDRLRAFQADKRWSGLAANALYLEGLSLQGMGKRSDAIAAWRRLTADHPDSQYVGKALFLTGYCLYEVGDVGGARECFQRVVDFHHTDSSAKAAKAFLDGIESSTAQGSNRP